MIKIIFKDQFTNHITRPSAKGVEIPSAMVLDDNKKDETSFRLQTKKMDLQ